MSSYGPPGQPPGPPPPPGSYGPPPATGGTTRFDPKTVSPLDWGILAAAVLSLIFSFFKYYSYKADLNKIADALHVPRQAVHQFCANPGSVPGVSRSQVDRTCNGIDTSAWSGFFGWFGVLLALVGAAFVALAVFAPQVKLPVAARLAALGAFVLAVISTLIALPVVPNYSGTDLSQLGGRVNYDDVVDEGHSFSYWIVLILLVVGLVLCFLRFQQTGGPAPAWRGSASAPDLGAQGPQQPGYGAPPPQSAQTGAPQPGYGAAPQPGYGAAPQPGYGTAPQPGYGTAPQPGYGTAPQPPHPQQQPPPPPPGYPPPQQ